MIELYLGTPGSGKSLHCAKTIIKWVEVFKEPVITNFEVNEKVLKKRKNGQVAYIPNKKLNVDKLVEVAEKYREYKGKRLAEDTILLVLDEAQLIFNSRKWNDRDRMDWISFFSQHRKLGYRIILVCQYREMIDKQIRELVEYEYMHRKVKNISRGAYFLNLVRGGGLHIWIKYYAPMSEKVDHEFFKGRKRLYNLYDSYTRF